MKKLKAPFWHVISLMIMFCSGYKLGLSALEHLGTVGDGQSLIAFVAKPTPEVKENFSTDHLTLGPRKFIFTTIKIIFHFSSSNYFNFFDKLNSREL